MRFWKVLLFSGMLALSGCTFLSSLNPVESRLNKKTEKKDEISVYVIAKDGINLDILDIPSPVRIHFLQLVDLSEFEQLVDSSFDDLDEKGNIRKSILRDSSYMVRPSEIKSFKILLDKETRYLGVVTSFRDSSIEWKLPLRKQFIRLKRVKNDYLYLVITKDGAKQISKKEALLEIAEKRCKDNGEDFQTMANKQKKKLLSKLRKEIEREQNPKINLDKGIFVEP